MGLSGPIICDTHVYALDLSNVPMLVPKANYKKKEKELYIAQLKAARTFVSVHWLLVYSSLPAKVNAGHMNGGLGKLLLAAAEEHSRRCLAAATCVADLFPTHWHAPIQVLDQGHMKPWRLCFWDPVHFTKGAHCKDDHWNSQILMSWYP